MDAVKFSQSYEEVKSINAAHNLHPMDRLKLFTADQAAAITPGTLLKASAVVGEEGEMVPWIQGTDAANLIVGIYAGAADLDTASDTFGLVRVFGPVRKDKLTAWTAADGSTTADASAAAIDQLETMYIFAL